MKKIQLPGKAFTLLVVLLFAVSLAYSQITYTWNGSASTAWDNTNNWTKSSGTSYPGTVATDIVVIPTTATNQPTLSTTLSTAIASLTFTSTTAATLTITGVTLNVTGAVTLNSNTSANTACTITGTGTLNAGSLTSGSNITTTFYNARTVTLTSTISNLTISGNLTIFSNYSNAAINATFTQTSGTVTVNGSVITSNENAANTSTYTMGNSSPTLILGGATPFTEATSGTSTFTLTGTGATVNYNRNGAQTVEEVNYTNLILSGTGTNTKTLQTGTTSVSGNLTLNGTAAATTVVGLTVGGNLTVGDGTNAAGFTAAGFALTVTGTTTVANASTLTISSASGTKTFTGDVTITGTFTESAAATVNLGGSLTNNGTFTASTGTHTFSGSSKTIGGSNAISIPTATFTGAYTNNGTLTAATSLTVTGVTLTNNGTITASTALSGTGGLTQAANATLNIGGTSGITTLTATANSNTVNYNTTAGGQTIKSTTYYTLTLGNTSGTQTAGGNITATTVNNNTNAADILNMATYTLSATTVNNTGTIRTQNTSASPLPSGLTWGGAITFDGAGQTIPSGTYTNLNLSGSGTKTFSASTAISSNLVIASGVTANLGTGLTHSANTLTLNTVAEPAGSYGGTGSSATYIVPLYFAAATGILNVTSGSCTAGYWYGNTSTDWNTASNWCGNAVPTSSTNVVIQSGTPYQPTISSAAVCNNLTINSGATLTISGTNSLAVSGTWTNNGTFTPNNSTVTFNGASQTIGTGPYYNLTLAGSGTKTLPTGLTSIGGNLTLNGTASATTTVGLTISGNLTVGDGTNAAGFTAAAFALTVTGTTTVANASTLTISSATGAKLFTGLVTVNATGTWNNSGNSAIELRGGITNNGTFTAGTGVYTFSTNAQALNGTLSIPNVTVTTITLTNNNTLTVGTALSGTGGLTQAANATLNIGGTSGITTLTATNNGNTVNYTGSGQTLKVTSYYHLTLSGGAETFGAIATISGNLTLSGTATATTGANLSIGGNLNIGNGTTLTIGAYTLSVTGTTTVGGGSSGTLSFSSATNPAKTFTGLVTINSGASWTESAAITPTFSNGITNNGTFTASTGVHTFSTNNQALTGTFSIPSVTVTTITLTNNNTLTVGTALSGTGGLTQAANATLNIGGTSGITTLTATANDNTVNYTGAAQTVKTTTYHNLSFSGSGAKTIASGTSVNGNFTMSGSATATPSAAFAVGGNTTLSGTSVLTLGAANILSSTPVILNGGSFSTGTTTGYSETVGTLALTANSTIALGTGVHSLNFSASNGVTWTGGTTLTITGWTGNWDGTSGTAGKIFFGSSTSGLTSSQLAQIKFVYGSNNVPATILSTGEVVPIISTAPSNLSYTSPNTFYINQAITALSPTVTGIVTNYSVNPALPSGLTLNSTTGVISGTPTAVTPTNTYTVTASNPAGSTNFGIVITVNYATSASDYFRTKATGNWNATATWQSSPDGSTWYDATLTPNSSANTITIRNGHTVNVTEAVTVDQVTIEAGGQVNLTSNVTLTIANGAGDDFVVNGKLYRTTGTITTTGNLKFNSGSIYQHAQNGGSIPTATWDANSTCYITGVTSTVPTDASFNQAFGNFTWECAQTTYLRLQPTSMSIAGNLTIAKTGSSNSDFAIEQNITVGKDLIINGNPSTYRIAYYSNREQTINGNVIISGTGELAVNTNPNTSYTGTLIVKGDFSHSSGTLISNRGTGPANIIFGGSGMQTYTSGGTLEGAVNFAVNSGAYLQMGTGASPSVISYESTGTFTLAAGATLGVTSPDGITTSGATGNVQLTGTRTFTSGANYIYNGSNAQFTGNGLNQNTPANLTVNNSAGVKLSNSTTISGTLTLTSGRLALTSNNLTLGTSSTIAGTFNSNNMVVADNTGKLIKNISSSLNGFTFPVGSATNSTAYSPVILTLTGTFSSAHIDINLHDVYHPSVPSSYEFIKRYWTISASGITGMNCDADFYYDDIDLYGDESLLRPAKYTGSSWSYPAGSVDIANNKVSFTGLTSFGTSSDFTAAGKLSVTINTSPTPPTVCAGDPITLTAVPHDGKSPYSYSWSPGSWGNVNSISPSPTTTTTYTVTVTDASNITDQASATVTVIAKPTAYAGQDVTVNQGTAYTVLDATATGGTVHWTTYGPGTLTGENTLTPTYTPGTGETNPVVLVLTVTNGSCYVNDDMVISYLPVDAVWTGNAWDYDWNTSFNWNVNAVPGQGTNVTIPSGLYDNYPYVLTSGACHNLTIESGAGLVDYENLTVTGTATVKKTIPNDWKWHFLSSPVSEQPVWPEFSPVPSGDPLTFGPQPWNWDFYYYNPYCSSTGLFWVNLRKTNGDYNNADPDLSNSYAGFGPAVPKFQVGRGYLVAYTTGWQTGYSDLHTFTGALNTGEYTLPVANISGTQNPYNLLGNPYPSSLDWQVAEGSGWDRSDLRYNQVGYDYWVWNDEYGEYGSFNSGDAQGSGINGADQYIAPLQAFFVQAQNTGSVVLDNRVRCHSLQPWLKSSNSTANFLRLQLTCSAKPYKDEVVVSFNTSFSGGGTDKWWSLYDDAPALCSAKDGHYYCIDRRSIPEGSSEVMIYAKPRYSGNYTITATNIGQFTLTDTVMLEDLKTQVITNLRTTPSYSFSGDPNDDPNRFRLILGKPTGVAEPQAEIPFTVFVSNGKLIVELPQPIKAEIGVSNMLGQTIIRQQISGKTTISLDVDPLQNGIYIVSLKKDKQVTSHKIVISK